MSRLASVANGHSRDTEPSTPRGPFTGLRVIEFAGNGPAPFCAMLFSDLGADVVRIEKPGSIQHLPIDILARGRGSIVLDLKDDRARSLCLEAVSKADILIEGFRPGVMERLALGPSELLERNPRLIYGRVTGWGREGPLAHQAGHDINYIALSGALAAIGPIDRPPPPPLNLIADFGGGALYLAFGIAAALFERERSGHGQVVDATMIDGVASMMSMFFGMAAADPAAMERGHVGLSGTRANYRCYECSDGQYVAVGAIEEHFSNELAGKLGIAPAPSFDHPSTAKLLERIFLGKTRDEWAHIFATGDGCVAPVLSFVEAVRHPQYTGRGAHTDIDGVLQPGAAPRFSRTPGRVQGAAPVRGEGGLQRLRSWGVATELR